MENGIGFVQAAQLHHGHHDAFGAELEGFFQVFARTHQRADHFDAVQHQARNRQIHGFGRQADGHHAAASAHAIHGGIECGTGHGGYHGGMGAAGFLLDELGRIFLGRVHNQIRTGFFGQRQFVVVDVHGDHVRAEHFLGVLHGQVAQAAGAVDGNPLTGRSAGHFDGFIGGYAGAGDAGSLGGIEAFGHFYRIIGLHHAVGGHAAVDGVARVQYAAAEGFAAGNAVFAVAAAGKQPGNAHAVAHFQGGYIGRNLLHDADAFVAEHAAWFFTVVAGSHVQVGVAHAAVFHFHQRFARAHGRDVALNDFYVTVALGGNNSCFHFHGYDPCAG